MEKRVTNTAGIVAYLHDLVREHPDFEALGASTVYGYCFRYIPNALAERGEEPAVERLLNNLNQQIVEVLQHNGQGWLTTITIHDRVAIRLADYAPGTLADDIDATFEAIARWGRLLSKKLMIENNATADMEASYV